MRETLDFICRLLEEASGLEVSKADIKESHLADYASAVAFKSGRHSPKEAAEEIALKINSMLKPDDPVSRVESADGYVNVHLNYPVALRKTLTAVKNTRDDYGKQGKKNKRIILEHTSVNPSGPLHVGRLRNSVIGDSLRRILSFSGFDVETHYYVNDVGKQIAIIAQARIDGVKPDEDVVKEYRDYASKKDFQVFFTYVSANRKYEDDPEFKRRVQELIMKAESGDKKVLESITSVARLCLEGQREVFNTLDIVFDFFDYESKYIEDGSAQKIIAFLKDSRYAKETEAGFGLDLSRFGLEKRGGLSILARSDGTSVYLTRDIAYHLEKAGKGDHLLNVLGEDHKLEFRELKTILTEVYGMKTPLDVVHFSFVNFEGMELSTRKGQIASVDQLIRDAVGKAREEIKKRGIADENSTAPVIGLGAIKYHLIKTTPSKPITFRWSEALSFDGDSAPYIQYAYARSCSLLRKSEVDVGRIGIDEVDATDLDAEEKALVRLVSEFPLVVGKSAEEYRPDLIATYLYRLASAYSRFYRQCPVISSENEGVKKRRLLLVYSASQVIKNGLNLLGINAPERM